MEEICEAHTFRLGEYFLKISSLRLSALFMDVINFEVRCISKLCRYCSSGILFCFNQSGFRFMKP